MRASRPASSRRVGLRMFVSTATKANAHPGASSALTAVIIGLAGSCVQPTLIATAARIFAVSGTEWVAFLADAQPQGRLDDELHRLERIAQRRELPPQGPRLGPRPAAKAPKSPDRYPSTTSPRASERLTTHRSRPPPPADALNAPIAAQTLPLGARPSRRRALWRSPREGVNSRPALRGHFSTGLDTRGVARPAAAIPSLGTSSTFRPIFATAFESPSAQQRRRKYSQRVRSALTRCSTFASGICTMRPPVAARARIESSVSSQPSGVRPTRPIPSLNPPTRCKTVGVRNRDRRRGAEGVARGVGVRLIAVEIGGVSPALELSREQIVSTQPRVTWSSSASCRYTPQDGDHRPHAWGAASDGSPERKRPPSPRTFAPRKACSIRDRPPSCCKAKSGSACRAPSAWLAQTALDRAPDSTVDGVLKLPGVHCTPSVCHWARFTCGSELSCCQFCLP